ncbi:NUDIX hydrolase [Emticicia fontis]
MINDTQETIKKIYHNRVRIRVCGICIKDEQVLMACHKGVINDKDVWLPPGGGMEVGETIVETLTREFLEETGFHIKVGSFLYKHEFIHVPIHAIELYFSVQIVSGELMKGTDPELNQEVQLIKDVKWIPVKNKDFFTEDVYLAINS